MSTTVEFKALESIDSNFRPPPQGSVEIFAHATKDAEPCVRLVLTPEQAAHLARKLAHCAGRAQ